MEWSNRGVGREAERRGREEGRPRQEGKREAKTGGKEEIKSRESHGWVETGAVESVGMKWSNHRVRRAAEREGGRGQGGEGDQARKEGG